MRLGFEIDPLRFHMRVNNYENPLSKIIEEITEEWELRRYEQKNGWQIDPFYADTRQVYENWFTPDYDIKGYRTKRMMIK